MRGLRLVAVVAVLATAGLLAAAGSGAASGTVVNKWQPPGIGTTTTTATTTTTSPSRATVIRRSRVTTAATTTPTTAATLPARRTAAPAAASPQPTRATTSTTDGLGKAASPAVQPDAFSEGCYLGIPIASLSADPTSGTAPLAVHFDGSGSDCFSSWTLDFGDESSTSGGTETPMADHTYDTPGTYTASLVVCAPTDGGGGGSTLAAEPAQETCSDPATVTITVIGPLVRLTPNPASGTVPLTVNFTGVDLNAPAECPITSWSLDFGDGSPLASGSGSVSATHTYTAIGNYIARLQLTDCLGSGSDAALVQVHGIPPTAVLDVLGGSGLQVTFSGANSFDPDDPIASWSLFFSDGTIVGSTGAPGVISHTFPAPGTYTVILTVTDTTNLSDFASVDVTVPFPVEAPGIPPVTTPPVTPPPIIPPPIVPPPVTLPPLVPPVLTQPPSLTPPLVLPQPVIPSPVTPPPPFTAPLLVPPPPAPPSPPPAPVEVLLALRLDQPSVAPGGEVTARGQGCPGSVPVTLVLGDKVVGATTSNPDGRFQAPVSTTDIPVGDYQLVAHCGDRTVTTQLAVVLAQSTPPSSSSLIVVFLFMLAALALLRRQLLGL